MTTLGDDDKYASVIAQGDEMLVTVYARWPGTARYDHITIRLTHKDVRRLCDECQKAIGAAQ